jgi:hypothetical protein
MSKCWRRNCELEIHNYSYPGSDLIAAEGLLYEPNGLRCNAIVEEKESKEYGVCLKMNHKKISCRRLY